MSAISLETKANIQRRILEVLGWNVQKTDEIESHPYRLKPHAEYGTPTWFQSEHEAWQWGKLPDYVNDVAQALTLTHDRYDLGLERHDNGAHWTARWASGVFDGVEAHAPEPALAICVAYIFAMAEDLSDDERDDVYGDYQEFI